MCTVATLGLSPWAPLFCRVGAVQGGDQFSGRGLWCEASNPKPAMRNMPKVDGVTQPRLSRMHGQKCVLDSSTLGCLGGLRMEVFDAAGMQGPQVATEVLSFRISRVKNS